MKLKKLPLLFVPFLLASCANKDYTGKYMFKLGKDKGTHIGIGIELKKDAYADMASLDDNTKAKNPREFEFSFNAAGVQNEMLSILGDDGFQIKGYYYLSDPLQKEKGKHLNLGVTILKDFFQDYLGVDEGINIPAEITELILSAYVDQNTLYVKVPVSGEDFVYQIYWYGYKIDIANFSIVAVDAHELGTHPTKEDVEKIRTAEESNDTYKNFRDFHQLEMGLVK